MKQKINACTNILVALQTYDLQNNGKQLSATSTRMGVQMQMLNYLTCSRGFKLFF